MCDPVTLALGAVSAGGSLIKGIAGSAAAKRNRDIARFNAEILGLQAGVEEGAADLARQRGAFEASRVVRTGERVAAGQEAFFGAAGIDAAFGSPLALIAGTARQAAIDAGLVSAQGELDRAAGLGRVSQIRAEAAGQQGRAAAFDQQAAESLFSGIIGAGTAALSAARVGRFTAAEPSRNAGGFIPVQPSSGPFAINADGRRFLNAGAPAFNAFGLF